MHDPGWGEGRTVKSEPVMQSASWYMVGDPPTGLQGYVPSTATLAVRHSSYVLLDVSSTTPPPVSAVAAAGRAATAGPVYVRTVLCEADFAGKSCRCSPPPPSAR